MLQPKTRAKQHTKRVPSDLIRPKRITESERGQRKRRQISAKPRYEPTSSYLFLQKFRRKIDIYTFVHTIAPMSNNKAFKATHHRLLVRAAQWTVRNPQLAERLQDAVHLTLLVRFSTEDKYGHHYSVPSSDGDEYTVTLGADDTGAQFSTCECADRPRKGWKGIFRCKHRLAVGLAITEGLVPAPGQTTAKVA